MTKTALVVGASGIVGSAACAHLSAQGWEVLGLARRPQHIQQHLSLIHISEPTRPY